MRIAMAALGLTFLVACSSSGGNPGVDAGVSFFPDAGGSTDGGLVVFDGGSPAADAGAAVDAGTPPDAGVVADAGFPDAGAPPDAGPPTTDPVCEHIGSSLESTHVSSLPAFADSNYANAEIRTVTSWPGGDGGPSDESRSLFKISLGAMQPNPAQVLLRLWVMQVGGACQQGQVSAYRITQNWTDTHVTWNNQPSHDPSQAWASVAVNQSTFGWITLDITALYREWQQTGAAGNFGFMLKASCDDILNVVFASRNIACDGVDTTAHQPTLLFNRTNCADDPVSPEQISNIDCN